MELTVEEVAQNYRLPLSSQALTLLKTLFQSYSKQGEETHFIEMTRRGNLFAEAHPSFSLLPGEALDLLLNKSVEVQSTFSLNFNYPINYPQLPKEYDSSNPINSQILPYTVYHVCYSNQKLRSLFRDSLPPPPLCLGYPPEVSEEIEEMIPSGERILTILDNLRPGILIKNYMIHLIRNVLLFLYARFKDSESLNEYLKLLGKAKYPKFLTSSKDPMERFLSLSLLKILEALSDKQIVEYFDLVEKIPPVIKEWLSFNL